MFRAIKMGRAFGIPLYLHPSFLLLPLYVLLMTRSDGMAGTLFAQAVLLTIFGCVLLHELGHALMARFFGIPTRDITLYPIGGVARLESTGSKPLEEIAIALAGPAVNLVLVVLLLPFVVMAFMGDLLQTPLEALSGGGDGLLSLFASYVTAVWMGNGILLVFNLVPAFPMDGGRVLRAVLALGMPRLRATEVAAAVGLVLAGVLVLLGVFSGNWSLVLVSIFVAFAGQMELQALRHREAIRQRENVLLDPIILPTQPVRFTGLAWDPARGVWVRWVNGVPLDTHSYP